MTATSEWLDDYLTAWRTKDADDIRAIFTDDAAGATGGDVTS